ncbi:MAG: amidohydrolase family protein [Hyphomicrobiaceae bacterium]
MDRRHPIWGFFSTSCESKYGIEGMITRMDPHTNEGERLGEPIDLETAIKIYTTNGAKAMMHEEAAVSIEVGKYADLIILNRNLFEIPPT